MSHITLELSRGSPTLLDSGSGAHDHLSVLRMVTSSDLLTEDHDMASLEDLTTGQMVLLPNRHTSVIGLTIDENLTCVENEFAENDCVIALYHVTRKPNGDWLIPNPDLPCLVNDEEIETKVLLSQGTVVNVGDRLMRYHTPKSKRVPSAGAPPKPSRAMRSQSVMPLDFPTPTKNKRSFSITMADEWCIIDIESEITSRQERLRAEGWCVIDGITTSDPLIEAITSAEQLCSIVSSHICHQTMVYTETTLSTHEIDDLFKYIKAMGPGNEMVMTRFVLEYHSHMNEEQNMGRALHRPVISLLTEFLKITLEPLEQTEFWLHLLSSFSDVRDNLADFLEIGTTPVVLGAMAACMGSEQVQQNGCNILANVSSVLPNHTKKGPIRESAVELVLMASRTHMENENVIRPACRTLANVTQTYATLIGRVLTPDPEDIISEDNSAIDNLARWLGIMEVIQEYGLPIIDIITAKFDDVIIQAECRRVVAFFRNNSFQTDSSDESTTDLPHLEMEGVTENGSIDSRKTSASSLLMDTDPVNNVNALNRLIVSSISDSSIRSSTQTDHDDYKDESFDRDVAVPYDMSEVVTVTSETAEVVTVMSERAETVEAAEETNTENTSAAIDKESSEDVEKSEMKDDSQPKKEKRSGWKWFGKLFGKDNGTPLNEKKAEKGNKKKKSETKPVMSKVTKEKDQAEKRSSPSDNNQDLEVLAKDNKIHAEMEDSFEELYKNYTNQTEPVQKFITIDLNNDEHIKEQSPEIQQTKTSTKFAGLQRHKFSLEKQKRRMKSLKTVAEGIVKMKRKNKYVVNEVDSSGNLKEDLTLPSVKERVVLWEPVTALGVTMTSSQQRLEEVEETRSSSDKTQCLTLPRDETAVPQTHERLLPSVKEKVLLLEPDRTRDVKMQSHHSGQNQVREKESIKTEKGSIDNELQTVVETKEEIMSSLNPDISLPSVKEKVQQLEPDIRLSARINSTRSSPQKSDQPVVEPKETIPSSLNSDISLPSVEEKLLKPDITLSARINSTRASPQKSAVGHAKNNESPTMAELPHTESIDRPGRNQPNAKWNEPAENMEDIEFSSVSTMAQLFGKTKPQEIIPISSLNYDRLRKRSMDIKSGHIPERIGNRQSPISEQATRENGEQSLYGDRATSHGVYTSNYRMGLSSEDINKENDLVESGEVRVFVTDNDVQIPGGIGASFC